MDERYIATENTYTQQNYFIQLCMGCTDYLSELEARYHKTQAEGWKNRARQLEGDNLMLHDKVEMLHDKVKMLQRHLAWYRYKVTTLKEENEHLREKLAMYRELELVLNGGK